MEIRYIWMVWFLDQVTVRNLKSPSLMHCRIASLLKSLILICEWSDKDVRGKKNQGRMRKLKIEEQPGESVAEDCVNWFDLPWESHCGEKCRHSLKKIFLQCTFSSKEHQRFGWFWKLKLDMPAQRNTTKIIMIISDLIHTISVLTEPFSVARSWFVFPFKTW